MVTGKQIFDLMAETGQVDVKLKNRAASFWRNWFHCFSLSRSRWTAGHLSFSELR